MARPKRVISPVQAERFKTILREQKVSQRELAADIFISQQQLSRIANGKVAITPAVAEMICRCFPEYRPSWLLGLDDFKLEDEFTNQRVSRKERVALIALQTCLKANGYKLTIDDDGQLGGDKLLNEFLIGNSKAPESVVILGQDGRASARLSYEELWSLTDKVFDYVKWEVQKLTGEWK